MTSYGGPLREHKFLPSRSQSASPELMARDPMELHSFHGHWARGKALAWDVTVADTFALSHVGDTSILAGAAANHAASLKISKYSNIAVTNICVPAAIESGGAWDIQASEFIQELGKRITVCTKDSKETQYLFQQLSMAIQRGNAVSFPNTFSND